MSRPKGQKGGRMHEIQIHGGAKYPNREMSERVTEITKVLYGITPNLTGVDLSSYYRSDGAKITKTLTTILRKELDKKQVQSLFAEYGRNISDLYTVSRTLVAFFGDKRKLGEGEYESGKTCFRKGGENESSREFLVSFRWARALVLQDKSDPKAKARCICYLGGGRNIYLTNFYWNGIQQNYLYFVSAIRTMFGLKKVLYRRNPKFFLPVYRNGDAIHIYDERSKLPAIGKLMPCPNCGTKVQEFEMHYEEIGSHRLQGCTQKCARLSSKLYVACNDCKEVFYHREMQVSGTTEANKIYRCRVCNRKNSVACEWCGTLQHKDNLTEYRGAKVCGNCLRSLPQCSECGTREHQDEMVSPAGSMICRKCMKKKAIICDICRCTSPEKCRPVKVHGKTIRVCKDCLEPAPGTDLGAVKEK